MVEKLSAILSKIADIQKRLLSAVLRTFHELDVVTGIASAVMWRRIPVELIDDVSKTVHMAEDAREQFLALKQHYISGANMSDQASTQAPGIAEIDALVAVVDELLVKARRVLRESLDYIARIDSLVEQALKANFNGVTATAYAHMDVGISDSADTDADQLHLPE